MRLILVILLLFFAGFTYFIVQFTNNEISDLRSRGESVNHLESESGTIGGNATAITKTGSQAASGGKYVMFSTNVIVSPPNTPTPEPINNGAPIIVGAGDIQCPNSGGSGWSSCRADATAQLISAINPSAVLPLGDTQYEQGEYVNFKNYYHPNWGRHNAKTYPVIGNHEWGTPNGAGYFDYFENDAGFGAGSTSKRPGVRGKGYYSYNIGSWHLIALNSNIISDASQMTWLKQDLVANSNTKCTLVYLHHPFFTSDTRPGRTTPDYRNKFGFLFQTLYDNNVDIWLNGHDHHYQRFKPSNINGGVDTTRGITQFTVGTGGDNHYWNADFRPAPNGAANDNTTFGVLKLTLNPISYNFEFSGLILAAT